MRVEWKSWCARGCSIIEDSAMYLNITFELALVEHTDSRSMLVTRTRNMLLCVPIKLG